MVYSGDGSCVDIVIIHGKIIMENREIKTLNEDEVVEKEIEKGAEMVVISFSLLHMPLCFPKPIQHNSEHPAPINAPSATFPAN
jgi:hypothetical protein